MVFHRSRIKTSDINVVMQQNTIDRVNSTKFSGLIIGDKLKWHEHIQHVKHKIAKSVDILYKIRHYLNKENPPEYVLHICVPLPYLWY